MAEKQRYTVSIPDHVSSELERRSKAVGATPTEYAGDVIRWWFGQGCPPVTHDEIELLKRVHPVPSDLNVWKLDAATSYEITDDTTVRKLLSQLGIPNLFAPAQEHDVMRLLVGFDNHPTHWLIFNIFKGSSRPSGDGLSFSALPKASVSEKQILARLTQEAKEMGAEGKFKFSQIPSVSVEVSPRKVR